MANELQNTGSFVSSTQLFDAGQFYGVDVNTRNFKDLLVLMHQQIGQMAVVLNTKTTGYYLEEIFNTGNQWFNPNLTDPLQLRPHFRRVVNMGALNPNSTQPHGITVTADTKFTYIGGAASDNVGSNYVPLPHANGGATDIIVTVNATNVVVTNNSGIAFTSAYVVLEYLEF